MLLFGAIFAGLQVVSEAAYKAPASKFATVNGARLEYLDWGGDGPPLLFLAGLGATAHVFNDLAPKFKQSYHCLGLTRRGFGKSEQTTGGYELDNFVRDIAEFARSSDLRDLTLIGHSYGGTEAVRVAELHPELIRRVVLLDTAYDPIPSDAPPAEDKLFAAITGMTSAGRLSSLNSYRTYEQRLMRDTWSDAMESDLHETVIVGGNGSVMDRTPGKVYEAIISERAKGAFHITKIPCPALLIFAHNPWSESLPSLHLDQQTKAEIAKAGAELEAARRSQIEAFRRGSALGKIVELEHTIHHCFIQRPARIVEEMRSFFADNPI